MLRLTGTATKELALFLAAALRNPERKRKKEASRHGEVRLETMLQCDKPTEIFSIREQDLETFVAGAKQYGILYCALKNPENCPDNLCDIMVKAEDAPKIRRIAERYGIATLAKATVEHEREKEAQEVDMSQTPNYSTADDLADELMGNGAKKETEKPHPTMAKTTSPHPSEPSYESKHSSIGGILEDRRPSVRKELQAIKGENTKERKPIQEHVQKKRQKQKPKKKGNTR